MPTNNLIIALSFAALFGAAIIWLLIYYIHRYIHLRCLELDHWFHILTPPAWRSPCRHCEGTGRVVKVDKECRSRSRPREGSRNKARGRQGKVRGRRMIEEGDVEWNGNGEMQRQRQALPASPWMQRQGGEEHYNPWSAWQGQVHRGQQMGGAYPQPAMYPAMYPQTCPQAAQHASPFMMPAPTHQQQAPQMAMPMPESVSSAPTYQKRERKAYTKRSMQSEPQMKPNPAPKRGPKVEQRDFIHIVDDLPPFVKEAIRKNRPPTSSSSSSSSSTSTEPAEEVPRPSIPQAAPRFADSLPFQFPQYPTRAWEAPTSYPRQWNAGGRPTEQARYASPYDRPGGRDSFETARWPANPRREYVMRTLRRRRGMASRGSNRRYDQRDAPMDDRSGLEEEEEPNKQAQSQLNGSISTANPTTKPKTDQPPAYDRVPHMSPMPFPIIEEPVSDSNSTKGKKPIIFGMPSKTTDAPRPRAPSVPTPFLDIWSLSNSPQSAVSSLHE